MCDYCFICDYDECFFLLYKFGLKWWVKVNVWLNTLLWPGHLCTACFMCIHACQLENVNTCVSPHAEKSCAQFHNLENTYMKPYKPRGIITKSKNTNTRSLIIYTNPKHTRTYSHAHTHTYWIWSLLEPEMTWRKSKHAHIHTLILRSLQSPKWHEQSKNTHILNLRSGVESKVTWTNPEHTHVDITQATSERKDRGRHTVSGRTVLTL